MKPIIGFHVSIISSENIPHGSYSVEIQYGNQNANLGHMKKNCMAHIGWYFPLNSSQLMTLSFSSITIQLYRGNHSYSKSIPFGSCSLTLPNIKENINCETARIPVSISDSAFSSVTCSLLVQIQIIYKSSIISLAESQGAHKPIALKLQIERGEFMDASWDSKFYCSLVFPTLNRISTSSVVGVNPQWNHMVILNDPAFLQLLTFTCEVYRKTDLMDEYIGSAEFAFSHNGQDAGEVIQILLKFMDKKNVIAVVHFTLQFIYCCSMFSAKIEEMTESPVSTLLSDIHSQDGHLSIASSRRSTIDQKSTTKLRFVKMHESFM